MTFWMCLTAVAAPFEPVESSLPDPAPIVGGEPSQEGDWPEIAALFVGDLYGCTGILVAPDLVLSAGHCEGPTSLPRSVVIGALDHTVGGEEIAVTESWRMPDWLETFDVAALALERPAQTPPVRLMAPCEANDVLFDGATAIIAGYGALDDTASETTTELHEAMVTIEDANCSDLERGCRPSVSPGGELRAGGDADTCVGDSGGPLYLEAKDGLVVAAITSRSALPAPTPCGAGGLYVRVDAIRDWLEAETGRTLLEPACDDTKTPPPEDPPAADPTPLLPQPPADCGCASSSPWGLGWLGLFCVSAARRRRART